MKIICTHLYGFKQQKIVSNKTSLIIVLNQCTKHNLMAENVGWFSKLAEKWLKRICQDSILAETTLMRTHCHSLIGNSFLVLFWEIQLDWLELGERRDKILYSLLNLRFKWNLLRFRGEQLFINERLIIFPPEALEKHSTSIVLN